MTKTERMKQAIQERQVAAMKAFIDNATRSIMSEPQLPDPGLPLKHMSPKPAKKPKKDPLPGYEQQPEKFDTALQLHDRSRLPAGAVFHINWDGCDWTGTLTLSDPLVPVPVMFTLTGRKLFRLLADIDGMYRAWKRQNASPLTGDADAKA